MQTTLNLVEFSQNKLSSAISGAKHLTLVVVIVVVVILIVLRRICPVPMLI